MSANLDPQARASYEHRKVLLQLSDNLSNEDCRKIIYLEGLSKESLGENNSSDPLNVLLHLEMRGKTTPEELIRILNDINRQDVAKLIAKTKKNPLTRKNSGSALPKLEDSLDLTMKNCEVLLEQTEWLIKLAASKGNKRIEEVVSEAKTNLTDGVQGKLKYAFRLFSSQSQSEHCGNFSNSSPPGPSPESSLTSKVSPSQSADLPSSPVHQCLPINKSDLKRAVGKLKPLGVVTQRGAVSPRMSRQNVTSVAIPKQATQTHGQGSQKSSVDPSSPTNLSRSTSDNEDDIYTLPGPPIKTTASPTETNNVTYYNWPVRPLPGSENQLNGKSLPVTGSGKTIKPSGAKPGPTILPKPPKGKSHTAARYTMEKSTAHTDDESPTDDSGFSDSRAFLKNDSPPTSPQQTPTQMEHIIGSGASYTPLIVADVHTAEYYKSVNRESIPGAIYFPLFGRERLPTGQQDFAQEDLQRDSVEELLLHSCTTANFVKPMGVSGLPSVSSYYHCANNIISVPFLDPVEVLMCDSFGCEYWNPKHDIKLKIPDGAIPPGLVAHIEIAVALYGPFLFSERCFPISPILWLCFQEDIVLRKPFEVTLPHIITDLCEEDIEHHSINFAKANHTQHSTDKLGVNHYVFTQVDTPFVNVRDGNQSYGILSADHCCFYCIKSNHTFSPTLALKAGYCFWCIERPLSITRSRDTVLLCATFFLKTCITALNAQYTDREGYYVHEPTAFKFKDPEDGSNPYVLVSIQDEKCNCIMAANPPDRKIHASQISFWDHAMDQLELMHAHRMYPPKVALTLELKESCSSHSLPIHIHTSGTHSELDKQIILPLGNPKRLHSTSATSINYEKQWFATDKPKPKDLLKELYKAAHKWEDIGILLDISPDTLDNLKTEENRTPQSRLREMLKIWLKKINPPPSWSAIVDALEYLDEEELASNLKQKYGRLS